MKHDSLFPPWADRLAAYFDGTLAPQDRQRVDAWLADHPDVADELGELQQLRQALRAASLPEPTDEAWAAVRERIEQALVQPAHQPAATAARPGNRATAWRAAAAAGILLAAALLYWQSRQGSDKESVFQVASADDIEILSVDAAGARGLLVGEPPLPAPMVMMAAGDARLRSVEIVPAGQFPEVWMGSGEQESPMIVAPFVAGQLSTP